MSKFWQNMDKATDVELLDKIMIGKNVAGDTLYADINQIRLLLGAFLSGQIIPSKVAAGANLGAPEDAAIRYAPAGTYTTPTGSLTVASNLNMLFWDKTTWSALEVPVNVDLSPYAKTSDVSLKSIMGNQVYTGTSSGLSDTTRCYVQQRKMSEIDGYLKSVKFNVIISGGFTTRNVAIVVLRYSAITDKYQQYSKTTIAANNGLKEYDMSSFGLDIKKTDFIGLQVLESNTFLQYTTVGDGLYGIVDVTLNGSGEFEVSTNSLQGRPSLAGNNRSLFFEALVSSDITQDVSKTISNIDDKGSRVKLVEKNNFGDLIDFQFNLPNAYFTASSTPTLEANGKTNSASINVVQGADYYIFTYLNQNMSIVNIDSSGNYTRNKIGSSASFKWELIKVTATQSKLGFSTWYLPGDGFKPLVFKADATSIKAFAEYVASNKVSLDGIVGLKTELDKVPATNKIAWRNDTLFFENPGSVKKALTFHAGYWQNTGVLNTTDSPNFRHAKTAVTVGKYYACYTRCNLNMNVVGLDNTTDTTGTVLGRGYSSSDPAWQLIMVKATKPLLGITYWATTGFPEEADIRCYEVNNGWLYDLLAMKNGEGVFLTTSQLSGILPQSFIANGANNIVAPDAYLASGKVVTNLNSKVANDGYLKSIQVWANQAGKIRCAIGLIDQRNWAIVTQEFDIDVVAGSNTIDVIKNGYKIYQGYQLFVYEDYYGTGTKVGHKLYTSAGNTLQMQSATGLTGTLEPLTGNGGYLLLKYYINTENFFFTPKSDGLETSEIATNAFTSANVAISKNNITVGDDGLKYRLKVVGGVVTAVPFKYKKVTVFGNSIWNHGYSTTAGWFVSDARGMAATNSTTDFRSYLQAGLRLIDPTAIVQGTNVVNWERNPESVSPSTYNTYLTSDVDLVIFRAGENVANLNDFKQKLVDFMLYCKLRCPNADLLITGSFWKNIIKDRLAKEAADDLGIPFVKMDIGNADTQERNDDVYVGDGGVMYKMGSAASHPSNLGMLQIANLLLKYINYAPLNDVLFKVKVVNNANANYLAFDKWVENGLFSLQIRQSTLPTISVVDEDGGTITTTTLTKADKGFSIADYVVVFTMPARNVTITIG